MSSKKVNKHGSNSSKASSEPAVPIQPLAISLCQQTGMLLTSPLSSILSLSLSSLYQDLFDMANDEISVAVNKQAANTTADNNNTEEDDGAGAGNAATDAALTLCTEKMSSLPFSQRRFELCSRMAKHSNSIKHICALLSYDWTTNIVQDCNSAFEHVHSNWIQADEAQDALFFAHSTLFFGRKWCVDVVGALKLICGGGVWDDFPVDVELNVNPYEKSDEKDREEEEVRSRLQCAVRRKLIEAISSQSKHWSRTVLEKGGGVVRLMFWEERNNESDNSNNMIEVRVTTLSEEDDAEWTLLSINVNVNPKTGESHHQLQTTTNRQKFDLHRLCVRSMAVEEARIRKKRTANKELSSPSTDKITAKPLDCLFEVAHTFAISQQLEILAAQADALKRGGIWLELQTSPIQYISEGEDELLLGVGLAGIHFWTCDDRFGMPLISDLQDIASSAESTAFSFSKFWKTSTSFSSSTSLYADSSLNKNNSTNYTQKFSLCIRTVPKHGIIVSLSGASTILHKINDPIHPDTFLKRNVEKILHSLQNPFHLSMSDALLASTLVCAQMRCLAVVAAIQSSTLPHWIRMDVDCATISIAVRIQYNSPNKQQQEERPFVTLFRFGVDSRTGRFISIFSSSSSLIRSLVCNDPNVSYLHQIRLSTTKNTSNTTKKRHPTDKLQYRLTGRIVRDHFEDLHRSLDILGKRVGLGDTTWEEHDIATSEKLRHKVVLGCVQDVFKSLFVCCGVCAVFGLVNHSLNVVFGVDCCVDMAGNIFEPTFLPNIIPVPPLSIVLNQSITGTDTNSSNDTAKRSAENKSNVVIVDDKTQDRSTKPSALNRQLLGVIASVDRQLGILIHFIHMETTVDSLESVPTRIQCTPIELSSTTKAKENGKSIPVENGIKENGESSSPPRKKCRYDSTPSSSNNDGIISRTEEIEYLSNLLLSSYAIRNLS